MSNVISAAIADRVITVGDDHDPLVAGCVGRDFVAATFDDEWDGLTVYCVYACGKQAVACPFDTDGENEVPHEVMVPGSLRLTFVGYDSDQTEILRTAHMRNGVAVKSSGQGMNSREIEDTLDVAMYAKQCMDALEAAIPQVEGEWATQSAEIASDWATQSAAIAAEWTADKAEVDTATDAANTAAETANAAADAAENAADDLAQRVQAGEFNGEAFSIKYTPASIAEMEAITGAKQGEFACIASDVDDPDNAKLYMYGNGAWNYITDMSGATGVQGAQGVQGVSFVSSSVDGTKVYVTRYDPATKQTTTQEIGDFAEPIAAAAEAAVEEKLPDDTWELIDTYTVAAGETFDRSEDSNGVAYDFKQIAYHINIANGAAKSQQMLVYDSDEKQAYGCYFSNTRKTYVGIVKSGNEMPNSVYSYHDSLLSFTNATVVPKSTRIASFNPSLALSNISRINFNGQESEITITLYAIRNHN